jgi:hypothetical protein
LEQKEFKKIGPPCSRPDICQVVWSESWEKNG